MELKEYRTDFLEQVHARASAEANFSKDEFVDYCGELLTDAEEMAN